MSALDIISRFAETMVRSLPPSSRAWGEAALAEFDAATADGHILEWSLGILAMSLSTHLRNLFAPWTRQPGDPLPHHSAAWMSLALLLLPAWFAGAAFLDASGLSSVAFAPFEALLANPATSSVFNLVSPLILLGAPALALWLNAGAILRIDPPEESGTIRLTIAPKLVNLAPLVMAAGMCALFLGYALLENVAG